MHERPVAGGAVEEGHLAPQDYLEAIYSLNEEKGYVSAADISDRLGVKPGTVSGMVVKLASKGYLEHERYRG